MSPLYWTKGLSLITGGQKGGQNSKKGTMALWDFTLTSTHTMKECMANQPWRKKNTNNLELMFCVCVSDKEFHKKELYQPKNATDVNACSHCY